jgi:hypothetical protein
MGKEPSIGSFRENFQTGLITKSESPAHEIAFTRTPAIFPSPFTIETPRENIPIASTSVFCKNDLCCGEKGRRIAFTLEQGGGQS